MGGDLQAEPSLFCGQTEIERCDGKTSESLPVDTHRWARPVPAYLYQAPAAYCLVRISSAGCERHWKRARGANKVTLLLGRYAVSKRDIIHRIQQLVSGNFDLKPRQLAADTKVATSRKSTVTRVLLELYRRVHSLSENIKLLGIFILARVMIGRCQK